MKKNNSHSANTNNRKRTGSHRTILRNVNKKLSNKPISAKKTKIPKNKNKAKTKKRRRTVGFIRAEENPIILPKQENEWESWQTFNPGVVLLNNKIHFIYRAIGIDGLSRFGYASSFERMPKLAPSAPITLNSFACMLLLILTFSFKFI